MTDAATFKASSMADLDRLVAFVARAGERAGADADCLFALHLAVEESFTNIMQYGYGSGGGPVTVNIRFDDNRISIAMRDRGPPFDPTRAPAPDLAADWQHREAGGLGVHLLMNMMDGVAYERDAEGENVLTMVKDLSGAATGSRNGGLPA